MSQFVINLIFVGLSFALYFGIAIWARAGSTSEFYVAGGGVHPVVNGMATAADWMSAASFISMAGLIAASGYGASTYLMGWTGGYVLLAMLLAPYLRKFGKFTVPDFIGDRFYSKTAAMIAVVCLITASTTYVIGQMTGAGVAFSRFLEVESSTGLIIAAIVVFFYAVLGGMKGITYTQVAQYVVLMIAYTIPAVFISLELTGNPIPGLGLFSNHVESGVPILTKLNQVVTDLGFASYTADVPNKLNMVLFTLTLMIGTAGLPHVIIRFFTVPKVADARWTAGWTLVFISLLYFTAPAVGAMARLNLIDTVYPQGVAEAPLEYDQRPDWMMTWEETGLIKYNDLNNDGRIQLYSDSGLGAAQIALNTAQTDGGDVAAATAAVETARIAHDAELDGRFANAGWAGNELDVNADILVLANPEIAQLPPWVIGLIAAGGLAAALSTAAGLLLAISSAISHDLIKRNLNPNITDKQELKYARITMGVAIVVATYLGMNPPGFAAQVVALAFGIAASSLFPVLMMGIFSKRINNLGAIAGMLTGLIVVLVYIFMFKGWFFISGTANFPDTEEYWLFGISPLSFGAVGALLNFIVAFAVSYATAPPPAHIQELVESVRSPRGAGGAVDH
ncbi:MULTISPECIES: sodium:solute symporter family protein [Psychrobacter]|jgi:cation/acetate symporter|uniref:sodium:solute symporter family protein n=1 Tax=Psychrobacter TaxID=497 RepID=UPI000430FECB|nr:MULTISPECIES: sodium:solute symporter family protein [Psychrobacter]GAF56057.1 LOW QUALITY PROTEIN: acetate permease ActP [Psychrobacter sp. JCM 18901]MBA6244288.1 cation acetate symporter [Psychrobacter sp. Urea-trap-18]MBA6286578.1 cation acetate symporter [Psychrobacter sp. Urea-trap-16]MBA6317575.1 cation acetate symporter [Psychrobacter sp. Urea-trap-20]MBA6334317.1 cation acetate symporter [Psychrobacter sp. Urea-trap-19]|tara:strand:- start:176 stop:2044 length:1869 start_codon:yes stop_codon:yes gene_type:complete